jgi:hypothetical protein
MAALAAFGLGVEVCGVEDGPQGVRVFVGPRYRGRYFLVPEGPDAERARRSWAVSRHLIMDRREVPYLLTEYQPTGMPARRSWAESLRRRPR